MFSIDRTTWIIIALVSGLLLAAWATFNRPDQVPVWPETINGVSFSPFRSGQSPQGTKYPSESQIRKDLALLSTHVDRVRTYSVESTLGSIPRLAAEFGMDVMVGVWISADKERNWREIVRLRQIVAESPDNIAGIVVGNEVLLRREITRDELAQYVDAVRLTLPRPIPVTVAETWDIWLKNHQLAAHVDFITAHVLPYWEGIPAWRAPGYVFERYEQLQEHFASKNVVLGEVGWPSEGRQRFGAVPSLQNQAKFLRQFLEQATARQADYFVLEAFDQIWKTDEGAVGRYWGIYNAQRALKFPLTAPVTPIPEWRVIAGASLAFAIMLLALLMRDSRGLVDGGRGFLVLVSFAISTAIVWMVYDYSQKYMTWDQVLLGIGLLLAALCITIILLAEAHEWAEAMWNRRHTRQKAHAPSLNASQPKVSIHVPTYNEPAEMVIETLAALRRLQYDNFEVIVVDNNTKDSSVWQPIAQWCERQDERFRFFHVDNLEGFKAGALNYAMRHTANDAELVAVIDSDYVVEPDWLSACTPAFDDEQVAIVQAPQDYRDADASLFKSMIYAEYAGFFGIGMVNRNVRNAIIQHGTMTIVRRAVLHTAHGWAQWCITEDAELGLRILKEGYRADYIPKTYGRGLMPDTFLDYKKQRFRWAYGSVLILRHHIRSFISLKHSKLTSGQRYHFLAGWLPWMADGLCLLFNCVALMYSVLMVMYPHIYNPPEIMLSLLPIGFFVFKLSKMLVLYRWRMQANLIQSLGAGIAGLAVSHTIARAMLAGLHTRDIGFFRTPKMVDKHSIHQAFNDAREEGLIAVALVLSAITIGLRDDAYLTDTRLWMTLLLVQSVPYIAAVCMSLVSTLENLPTRLTNTEQDDSLLEHLSKKLINADR